MRTTPKTVARARVARRWATTPEKLLWQELRNRKLAGYKFRRKAPIGTFVVDFLCPSARLVVEVTGKGVHHTMVQARDVALRDLGYGVIRLTREDVETDLTGTLHRLAEGARVRS